MSPEVGERRQPHNSLGASRRVLLALGDRRLSRRYPITVDLDYKAVSRDGAAVEGFGRTLNLSTSGVLFSSDRPLCPGMRIELAIAWPALLNDSLALDLRVCGRVARAEGTINAMHIRTHEFYLRGRYRVAPRFRIVIPAVAARAASAGSLVASV